MSPAFLAWTFSSLGQAVILCPSPPQYPHPSEPNIEKQIKLSVNKKIKHMIMSTYVHFTIVQFVHYTQIHRKVNIFPRNFNTSTIIFGRPIFFDFLGPYPCPRWAGRPRWWWRRGRGAPSAWPRSTGASGRTTLPRPPNGGLLRVWLRSFYFPSKAILTQPRMFIVFG